MSKVSGYVVVGSGGAYRFGKAGVLWISARVTVFRDRAAARAAITATTEYAQRNGYAWAYDSMVVKPVEPAR